MLISGRVMQISVRKFESGERYVFLLNDDGIPDFWVTHFVSSRLRMNKAWTSIEQYLKDIKHLKLWEAINNRDLFEEIYQGKVLSRKDISDIQEHCRYSMAAFRQRPTDKISDMGKFYLSTVQDKPTVSRQHFLTRIAHIADFLHFIGQEHVKHKATAAKLFDELDVMKKRLKSDLPKARLKKRSLDKLNIPSDAFEDFVEVAKFNSAINPFKNPAIRLRNYIIVQTFYETGIRRSELVALQISDIGSEIDNPTLTVRRRHDNKDDPRKREPTAKTLGRSLPISKELRSLYNSYIKKYRIKTKMSKTHPYIFVSHQGRDGKYHAGEPIEVDTVNKLFNKIKSVNPERFFFIGPHQFRHNTNDKLSEMIDKIRKEVAEEVKRLESAGRLEEAKQYAFENTITEQRELEIRAELNGHSSLDSGRSYLKRTAKKQATYIRNKMYEVLKHKAERLGNDH